MGKDYLVGRDLKTGREVLRKKVACRFGGLPCGGRLITASSRAITGW